MILGLPRFLTPNRPGGFAAKSTKARNARRALRRKTLWKGKTRVVRTRVRPPARNQELKVLAV
jgi:hypothetical protein